VDTDCTTIPGPPATPAHLAIGTWALAGDAGWGYGPCDPATARETVAAALGAGCRHFDTAALFGGGAVESLLGEMLAGRDDLSVTTRVGCRLEAGRAVPDFAPASLPAQVEQSARRLRRSGLDCVLLHLPAPAVLRDGRALAGLLALKAAGRVREVGASVAEPEEAELAIAAGADRVCVPYNPANRKAEARLFDRARSRGVTVQVREPLHNGRLVDRPREPADFAPTDVRAPWPDVLLDALAGARDRIAAALPGMPPGMSVEQAALGYALGHPAVDRVVVGCRGAAQVAAAFGARALTEGERERVNRAVYGPPQPGRPRSRSARAASSMACISSSDRP
jgi:aryl-alcohol dehydrogenase-like predicted oxidoreductase